MAFSNTFITLNDVNVGNLNNLQGNLLMVSGGNIVSSSTLTSDLTFTGTVDFSSADVSGLTGQKSFRTFRHASTGQNIIADQAEDVIRFAPGDGIQLNFNVSTDTITFELDPDFRSGFTGSTGGLGYTGSKGATGSASTVPGYTGSAGLFGYTGSAGPDGFTGSQGGAGFTGSTGDTGAQGTQGFAGSVGATGSQGNIGFTGSQGIQGITGFVGSQGSVGPAGNVGLTGNVGFTGSQGDTGLTGVQGTQGNIGFTGSQGNIGLTGNVGFTGSQGTTGNIGLTGNVGFTGSQGTTGNIGLTGNVGFTGSQGILVSDAGIDGNGHLIVTLSNASTIDAGFSLGYTGSQGNQGDQGNIGFTGSQGTQGIQGYTGSVAYTFRTVRIRDENGATKGTNIIADQSEDVLNFKEGKGIVLDANHGLDQITISAADFPDIISQLSVATRPPSGNISTLEFNNTTGVFTFTSNDLSTFASKDFVNTAIQNTAVTSLNSIGDVNVPNPNNGDSLIWSDSQTKWVSAAVSGGGGANANLTFQGDTGSDQLSLLTDVLGILGTTDQISTTVTNNNVTISLSDNPIITGNLLVGSTLNVSGDLYAADNEFQFTSSGYMVLSANIASGATPSDNFGIVVNRGVSANTALIWDEGSDGWVLGYTTSENNISTTQKTKLTVGDVYADITANSVVAQNNITINGYQVSNVIDDDTMGTASNTSLATSESIKEYVDSKVGTGYTGSQGNIGFTGSRGTTGFAGSKGNIGFTGSKGDVGFTGSQGTAGNTGIQGDTGFTGSQGDIGFTGSQGTAGIQGVTGFTGSKGDLGFTGSRGNDGTSVNIVGSVPTASNLPNPYTGDLGDGYITTDTGDLHVATQLNPATWENVGRIVGYTGSQGNTGFTGSQGDTGFTGSQGDTGFTGSQGNTGFTGSQGDTGFTGSASTIAGPTGFTGSAGASGNLQQVTDLGNVTTNGIQVETLTVGGVPGTGVVLGLALPVNPTDAASKAYVDSQSGPTYAIDESGRVSSNDYIQFLGGGVAPNDRMFLKISDAVNLNTWRGSGGGNQGGFQFDLNTTNQAINMFDGADGVVIEGTSLESSVQEGLVVNANSFPETTATLYLKANNITGVDINQGAVRISESFTLPTSDGSANQALITDGSGTVTWQDAGVSDLLVNGDTGSGNVDLRTQALDIQGGTNLSTLATGNTVTVSMDSDVSITNLVATGNLTAGNVIVGDGVGGFVSGAIYVNANSVQAVHNLILSGYTITAINDDDSMSTASNTSISTDESIKAYVDSRVGTGFTGSQGSSGFTGSKGDQGDIGYTGSRGSDGTSVNIVGSVPTASNLPNPYTGDLGDGYITTDTGSLHVATQLNPAVWDDIGRIVGYTGSQGSQGDIGFTGSKGDQGIVGFTGSKGDQGIVGFTGSQGDQGNIGFTGSRGDQGIVGFTGSKGDQGNIGFTGSRGEQGIVGFTGSQGNIGYTGSKGDAGVMGQIGFTGSKGDQGVTGFTGSKGAIGFTGSKGDQGIQGVTGFTGSKGNIGFTGSKGDFGYTGSKGDQGNQGIVGFTGSKGDQGIVGFTGSKGDQGDIGYTGSRGSDGTSVNIVGSVSTASNLPNPYTGDLGDGYITTDTGDLHVATQLNPATWENVGRIVGYTGSQGLIGFTGSVSTVPGPIGFTGSRGDPAPDDAANISYSNTSSNLHALNVQAALDELDSDKLDATALTSSLIYYATSASSNVATYGALVTSPLDSDYDEPAVDIPTGVITGSNQFISSLVSEAGTLIGSTGRINVTTLGNIRKAAGSGSGVAQFYFEVYKRDTVGTEALLGTSNPTPAIDGSTYQEFFTDALINPTDFVAGDSVVIKFYGDRIAGGSDPSYEFQFGGSSPVRTLLPVAVSVVAITPPASAVITDTSNFNGILSASDTNVQLALDTLDDMLHVSDLTAGTGINVVSTGNSREVSLANTTVIPGTYGNASTVPVITVDDQGRLSNVTAAPFSVGSLATGAYFKINYSAGAVQNISDLSPNITSVTINNAASGDITINFSNDITYPFSSLGIYGYQVGTTKYLYNTLTNAFSTAEIPAGYTPGSTGFTFQVTLAQGDSGATGSGPGGATHTWVMMTFPNL